MKNVIALIAVVLVPGMVMAEAVDLSSLRYDFGGGAANATFNVEDGVNPDMNDSFTTTLTFNQDTHSLTADVWGAETDISSFSLLLSISVDPYSVVDSFGNHGFFEVVVRNTDNYNFNPVYQANLTPGTTDIEVDLSGFDTAQARALTFQLYGGPAQNLSGDVTYTVNDVRLQSNAIPEPSAMAMLGLGSLFAMRRRNRR